MKPNISLRIFYSLLAAAAAVCLPAAAQAAPGDLYADDAGAGNIVKFTPAGNESTFASGLLNVGGLAFDRAGNLFVADNDSNQVFKFAPDGTSIPFASQGAQDLAFDAARNLFAAEGSAIVKYAPDGTSSTFAAVAAKGLAFDISGNLFAASGSTIFKFSPNGTRTTFASGLTSADSLAFDRAGNLFVSDSIANTVFEFSPAGVKTTFAAGLNSPRGLAFDNFGNLFVTSGDAILKFTPSGTSTTFASPVQANALAFEPIIEKVRNVSTRAFVGTGDNVLIAGFILGGNGLGTNPVVIRAIGPSLPVAGPLADPVLELHNPDGTLIAVNDDWQQTQSAQINSLGLAPTDPRESAIYATLPAGNFTGIVRGAGDTTGVALVEVFSVREGY